MKRDLDRSVFVYELLNILYVCICLCGDIFDVVKCNFQESGHLIKILY